MKVSFSKQLKLPWQISLPTKMLFALAITSAIAYYRGKCSGLCQTSMMELFCGNTQPFLAIN